MNDQCGYYYVRTEVLDELHQGRFDSLIDLARRGMKLGLHVFNVQLMAPSLIDRRRDLVPQAVRAIYEATGCCIAVDARDPETVDLALAAYPHKAMCNSVNGELSNLETMLPVIAKHGASIGTALGMRVAFRRRWKNGCLSRAALWKPRRLMGFPAGRRDG